MGADETDTGQGGASQSGRGGLGRLRRIPPPLAVFLICFSVAGLTLGWHLIRASHELWEPPGTTLRGFALGFGGLFWIVIVAVILGFATALRRRPGEWIAGYCGVIAGGTTYWLVRHSVPQYDHRDWQLAVDNLVEAAILTAVFAALPFIIAGGLGAIISAAFSRAARGAATLPPGHAPAGSICPHCGQVFSEGLTIVYRGQPCPNCGMPWEGTGTPAAPD